MKRWIVSLCACCFLSVNSYGVASRQDLDTAIANLDAVADAELSQGVEIINAISVVTANPLSLTMGTVAGTAGSAIDLPIYFKSGTSDVSTLQLDVKTSSGLVVSSVLPGIAAQAAGKGAQGNSIAGGFRVLVFGINANAIASGPVAILRVNLGTVPGKFPVTATGIVGASPAGASVPLTIKSGTVTVR